MMLRMGLDTVFFKTQKKGRVYKMPLANKGPSGLAFYLCSFSKAVIFILVAVVHSYNISGKHFAVI